MILIAPDIYNIRIIWACFCWLSQSSEIKAAAATHIYYPPNPDYVEETIN